jgi:hypothetical protein
VLFAAELARRLGAPASSTMQAPYYNIWSGALVGNDHQRLLRPFFTSPERRLRIVELVADDDRGVTGRYFEGRGDGPAPLARTNHWPVGCET